MPSPLAGGPQNLPLPVWVGFNSGNAALAAAGEATVTVGPPAVIGSWPTNPGFTYATIIAVGEANVQYVAQVTNVGTASISVKVKNVGSAAGTQTWAVHVLCLDPFSVPR